MTPESQFRIATISCAMSLIFAGPIWAQGDLGQTLRPNNNQVNADSRTFNGINESPWYSNSAIRDQLQLNDEQYRQLNDYYGQAYYGYRTSTRRCLKINDSGGMK